MHIFFIAIFTAVFGLFVNTGPPPQAATHESSYGYSELGVNTATIVAFDSNDFFFTKEKITDDGGVLDGIGREWAHAVFDTGDALGVKKDRVRCLSDKGRRIVTLWRTTVYTFGTTCIVEAIDAYRFKGAGRGHAPI
jgi:hypothetical protein